MRGLIVHSLCYLSVMFLWLPDPDSFFEVCDQESSAGDG